MKQRTRNILKAAEAALNYACGCATLAHLGERDFVYELLNNDISSERNQFCLYLCFAAAMNETGDLP